MIIKSPYLEAPPRMRAFVRAHETSLVALASVVGLIGGLVVAAMSAVVELLHVVLFNLDWGSGFRASLESIRRAPCWFHALADCCSGLPFLCSRASGRRVKSTRSRPMRCTADGCHFVAASASLCRRSGPAA